MAGRPVLRQLPESFADLVKQRKRWARGLLHVAGNRAVPLRNRLLLKYALASWVLGPLQHVFIVLVVSALLGLRYRARPTMDSRPVGAQPRRRSLDVRGGAEGQCACFGERPPLRYWFGLVLIPIFTLVEGYAGLRGFIAFVKDRLGWGSPSCSRSSPRRTRSPLAKRRSCGVIRSVESLSRPFRPSWRSVPVHRSPRR